MREDALHKAIRHFGSQKALAKAINVSPARINNWLNRNTRIPYEYAEAIEKLTNGSVNKFDLAPHVQFLQKCKANQKNKEDK